MNTGHCIWVDGDFLSSWPIEKYNDFCGSPDSGKYVGECVIFEDEEKAQSVVQALRKRYNWGKEADCLFRVVPVVRDWIIAGAKEWT